MFHKFSIHLIFIFLCYGPLQAQNTFSLDEALEYGIKHSYDLQSKTIDVNIQKEQNKEITAAAYPQINGSSNFNWNYKKQIVLFPDFVTPSIYGVLLNEGILTSVDPSKLDPNQLSPVSFVQNFGLTGQAQLTQLLFEPSVFVGLKARDASIELSENQVRKSTLDVKENIYKAYYAVLIADINMDLIELNISLLDSLKHNTEAIYKAGFAEKLDVDRLEVQLNNLKTEKVKAKNFQSVSQYSLKYYMNYPMDDPIALSDSLSRQFVANMQVLLDIPISSTNTIDYQILMNNKKLADLNVMRYKYQRLPTLSFFANYGFNSPTNDFNYFTSDANFYGQGMMGLSLSVPLFTAGANKARVAQARYQADQLDLAVKSLDLGYQLQNKTLKSNLENALIALTNQDRNIELARKVFESTKIKYETGVGSSIEVIQANTNLQQAQTNYYQSLYEAVLAKINILKALNRL